MRVLVLLLFAAAAQAGTSLEAVRRGLSADSRGARERAEAEARRLARTDPAGVGELWDRLDVRGRCGLVRALASAGTRHAALVALARAEDPSREVFRALSSGLAQGGRQSLFCELPKGLPASRVRAIELLRLRWRVEAELVRLKSPAGATGHYTGQFSGFRPLGRGVIPIFFDIVADRAVPLLGEASSGPFEAIHPEMVRYDRHELRDLVAHGFGEITERTDKKTIARLRVLFSYYWKLPEEEYDFERNSLAPALAYSLHDLGQQSPVGIYISDLKRRMEGGGYDRLRAMWSLGYAYIRIGRHEEGESLYREILDQPHGSISRHVAAYNLACNFAMRARQDPNKRKLFKRYAFKYLEWAVELNWWDWNWMEADGDLDFIRDDSRYKKILAELKRKWPDRRKGTVAKKLEDFLGGPKNK